MALHVQGAVLYAFDQWQLRSPIRNTGSDSMHTLHTTIVFASCPRVIARGRQASVRTCWSWHGVLPGRHRDELQAVRQRTSLETAAASAAAQAERQEALACHATALCALQQVPKRFPCVHSCSCSVRPSLAHDGCPALLRLHVQSEQCWWLLDRPDEPMASVSVCQDFPVTLAMSARVSTAV